VAKDSVQSFKDKLTGGSIGVVVGIILTVVLLLLFPTLSSRLQPGASEQVVTIDVNELERKIEAASDLTVTKVRYAGFEVANNEKSLATPLGNLTLPFTANSTLIAYKGTIGLGFDVKDVKVVVDEDSKTITVTLPPVRILYDDFDNAATQSYKITNSVFNPVDFELSNSFIQHAKEVEEDLVMKDASTLQEARDNAQAVIAGIIGSWDLAADYTVVFK